MSSQRKIRNYLINPVPQLRLVGISVGLLLVFTVSVIAAGYFSITTLFQSLVETQNVNMEIKQIVAEELARYSSWLIVLLFIFASLMVGVLIIETHKLVGAAYAINRYVEQNLLSGDYKSRLKLREGDFMQDVAQSLNALAEQLDQKKERERAES